jgi:hypothetical protein
MQRREASSAVIVYMDDRTSSLHGHMLTCAHLVQRAYMDTHYSVTRWFLIQKIKIKDDLIFSVGLLLLFSTNMQEKLIILKIKDDARG